MNNDRHGESCAREVGARVDTSDARPTRGAHARQTRGNQANPTRDWEVYRERLLRSFFREAAPLAARYRVSADDVLARAHALAATSIAQGTLLKPVACIGDFTVATACCLGRANAWNELWVFAEPSMTRAAFSRLPETLALTWTRRAWTEIERESRAGTGGLVRFDGLRPIRLWLVEQLLARLEEERAAGRLEIRRDHIGRPLPLRLVGELLA
ncbi:MAG: hypothetical protein RI967_2087 [Planctomycetota bacterium]